MMRKICVRRFQLLLCDCRKFTVVPIFCDVLRLSDRKQACVRDLSMCVRFCRYRRTLIATIRMSKLYILTLWFIGTDQSFVDGNPGTYASLLESENGNEQYGNVQKQYELHIAIL